MARILNENGGSRTDTIVKLVLIFFISLLSFSVGTYVGKQVSDNDHRRAQIEGDYQDTAKHAAGHGEEKSDGEKLSEDEIASLTEEFVTKEKPEEPTAGHSEEPAREVASAPEESSGYKKFGDKKGEPAHGEHEAAKPDHDEHATPAAAHTEAKAATKSTHKEEAIHDDPEAAPAKSAAHGAGHETGHKDAAHETGHKEVTPTKMDAPAKAATRLAEGQAPAADPKAERKPLSVLPSVAASTVGKFTVQVASYPGEEEAKTHATELKGKGWNAFYVPAEIQGKTWYRVSVGLFTTAKSATEFRKEFQKEAKVETAIVQKIVN